MSAIFFSFVVFFVMIVPDDVNATNVRYGGDVSVADGLGACVLDGDGRRIEQHQIVRWIGCDGVRALVGLPQQTAFTGVEIMGGISGAVGSLFAGVSGLSAASVIALAGVVVGVLVSAWCVAYWKWCKQSISDIALAAQTWVSSKQVDRFVMQRLPYPASPRDQRAVRHAIAQHIEHQWIKDVESSENPLQLLNSSAMRFTRVKNAVKSQAPKVPRVTLPNNGKNSSTDQNRTPNQIPPSNAGGRFVPGAHKECFKNVGDDLYEVSKQKVERINNMSQEIDLLLKYVEEIIKNGYVHSHTERTKANRQLNEWRKNMELAKFCSRINDKYLPAENSEHLLSKIRKEILFGQYGERVRTQLEHDVKAKKVRVVYDYVSRRGQKEEERKIRYVRVRN